MFAAILAAADVPIARPFEKFRARVARETRHEILMLLYSDVFDDVDSRVDGSGVILLSQVTRPMLKRDAGNGRGIP